MGEPRSEVLLVEDDADVRTTTALILIRRGFDVRSAANAAEALEELEQRLPDLVVADVGMPDVDGMEFTRRLRRVSQLPVLLLTARDLPSDVVAGLEAGADDYLTKPFDGDVLVARLRALQRRAPGRAATVVRVGGATVDRVARTVHRDGAPVAVSPTEFRLLEALIDSSGAAVTRQQLLQRVWGDGRWIEERVVDTNVLRLRGKLGDGAIETVRGFGYRIAEDGHR